MTEFKPKTAEEWEFIIGNRGLYRIGTYVPGEETITEPTKAIREEIALLAEEEAKDYPTSDSDDQGAVYALMKLAAKIRSLP